MSELEKVKAELEKLKAATSSTKTTTIVESQTSPVKIKALDNGRFQVSFETNVPGISFTTEGTKKRPGYTGKSLVDSGRSTVIAESNGKIICLKLSVWERPRHMMSELGNGNVIFE